MTIFGRISFVGDLREVPTTKSTMSVLGIEVKTFVPRHSAMGIRAGVTGLGLELRNELAETFVLQAGDWICVEYDVYPARYADAQARSVCTSRIIVNRYAPITDFDELIRT